MLCDQWFFSGGKSFERISFELEIQIILEIVTSGRRVTRINIDKNKLFLSPSNVCLARYILQITGTYVFSNYFDRSKR